MYRLLNPSEYEAYGLFDGKSVPNGQIVRKQSIYEHTSVGSHSILMMHPANMCWYVDDETGEINDIAILCSVRWHVPAASINDVIRKLNERCRKEESYIYHNFGLVIREMHEGKEKVELAFTIRKIDGASLNFEMEQEILNQENEETALATR